MKIRNMLIMLAASNLLAACGGGGSGGASAPATTPVVAGTQVPVAATLDFSAAIDFVAQVVARGEANAEDPLIIGDVTLATSDTADPAAI